MAVGAWTAGQRITAARLNLITPRWSSWTPTWTTSTGSATPSFGDATLDCAYCQVGDIVHFRLVITFGASTNFGTTPSASDNWRFSTPVTAAATTTAAGFGEIVDVSASGSGIASRLGVRVSLATTSTFALDTSTGRVDATALTTPNWGALDSVSPWTWASGDLIRVFGQYPAA